MTSSPACEPVRIGIVSISDRASAGTYEDKGLPALQDWLQRALHNPISFEARLIPDETEHISATLIELVDASGRVVRAFTPLQAGRVVLDVAGVDSGLHLVRLTADGRRHEAVRVNILH